MLELGAQWHAWDKVLEVLGDAWDLNVDSGRLIADEFWRDQLGRWRNSATILGLVAGSERLERRHLRRRREHERSVSLYGVPTL